MGLVKSDSALFLNVYCHTAVLAKMDADMPILDPMVDQVGPPPDVELKGERRRRTSKQPPDRRAAEKADEANAESGGADKPDEEVEMKEEVVENSTGNESVVLDAKVIDVEAEALDKKESMKDRKRKRGAGKKEEKVKKTDDEKAEAKKKRRGTSKVRTRSRGETKMLVRACDVDSGEEGYDDDDDEEEAPKEEKPKEALAEKAGEDKEDKGGAKVKAKCKAKVAKEDKKPVRDQCKSKKFHECLPKLPESLRNHFHSLSRYEQTQFIHDSVSRERGRLSIDQSTMMRLMTTREELQAGREKMKGYALEDLKIDKHADPNINKTQHFQIRFPQLVATAENILLLIFFPSSSQTTKP